MPKAAAGGLIHRVGKINPHSDAAYPPTEGECPYAALTRDNPSRKMHGSVQSVADILFLQGVDLGIVRAGRIIYTLLSPDGKTHTIGERLTHDTLNESGTFDGGSATTRAEALTNATILTIASEAVLHACRNDAELALGFLVAASQARRRSIDTIADLAFAHVLQRVPPQFVLTHH